MDEQFKELLAEVMKDEIRDRERVSLYLSRSALDNFKQACDGVSPSKVIERFMKSFVRKKTKDAA